MPLTLVVGNKNYSSWSLRPWLFLREMGVAFDEVVIPLDGPEFARRIGEYSPTRRVPVLIDGDLHVWDSLAICEHAIDHHSAGRGWPVQRDARALARCVVAEMHSGFQALRSSCPMNVRRRMEHALPLDAATQRDVARVRELWRDARARFGAGGEFLFGDFSLADAFFAPVVTRFATYAIAAGDVERRYMDAVLALPAMREWLDASRAESWALEPTDRVGT